MFGIGLPEMIVILIVALIVVGPDKLPDLARSLAKGVNELRGAMNQIKESLNEETKVISSMKEDLRQTAGQMKSRLLADDGVGGPRRLPDAAAEIEADMDALAKRPWAQDEAAADPAAAHPDQALAEHSAANEEPPEEERVVGRNPAPKPEPSA